MKTTFSSLTFSPPFFPTQNEQNRCATSGACASPDTAASRPTGQNRTGSPTWSGSSQSPSAA